MTAKYGAAGRMAAAFIHSKLTPLFVLASMALGALAVMALPREEEPADGRRIRRDARGDAGGR